MTPISKSRWIQDRQNFVSIYHEQLGLILGGGNTKLQPGWSNFSIGDMAFLTHTPGDTSPNFLPKGELYHVPKAASLTTEPQLGLDLTYGPETCCVRVEVKDAQNLVYRIATSTDSQLPVIAHLTLPPRIGEVLKTGKEEQFTLSTKPISLSADQLGGQLTYAGCRFQLPDAASLHWPALPHNPYRKDGRATAGEGRIEIRIPFAEETRQNDVRLELLGLQR